MGFTPNRVIPSCSILLYFPDITVSSEVPYFSPIFPERQLPSGGVFRDEAVMYHHLNSGQCLGLHVKLSGIWVGDKNNMLTDQGAINKSSVTPAKKNSQTFSLIKRMCFPMVFLFFPMARPFFPL